MSSCRAGPFEREGKMQRRTDFAAGSEQESERQGASRKNNLAETNAQTTVLGGWLEVDKRGPEKWNIWIFNFTNIQ